MNKARLLLLRLFLLIVSATFIFGGRSYIISERNYLCYPAGDQTNDLETPDFHFFSYATDEERWFSKEEFHVEFQNIAFSGIVNNSRLIPDDFSDPVWQPPK